MNQRLLNLEGELWLTGHDYIGIADCSAPSRQPRFHLLDIKSERA
jgi:hypothetical protein